jgi:hypothetical protein
MHSLLEISKKFVGQPYELGKCDCLTMIIDYLRLLGVKVSKNESFKEVNLKNYADLYRKNSGTIERAADWLATKCKDERAADWLATKCKEVQPHESLPGDILYLEENGTKFFGIDGGNGKVIAPIVGDAVSVLRSEKCKRLRVFRHG